MEPTIRAWSPGIAVEIYAPEPAWARCDPAAVSRACELLCRDVWRRKATEPHLWITALPRGDVVDVAFEDDGQVLTAPEWVRLLATLDADDGWVVSGGSGNGATAVVLTFPGAAAPG